MRYVRIAAFEAYAAMFHVRTFAFGLAHMAGVIVVYQTFGLGYAVATLIAPGLSQFYWAIRFWIDDGDVLNVFSVTIVGYATLMALEYALGALNRVIEPKEIRP